MEKNIRENHFEKYLDYCEEIGISKYIIQSFIKSIEVRKGGK